MTAKIYKLKSIEFALALCMISLVGAFTPRVVLANYLFEFNFLGTGGQTLQGTVEVNTNTGPVSVGNVVAIGGVSSFMGSMASIPFSMSNPVTSFEATLPTPSVTGVISSLGFGDPGGTNDFGCSGPGGVNQCDFQYTTSATVNYDDVPIEEQSFTAVPEPATVLLMGLGFAGLGFARRRRLNA